MHFHNTVKHEIKIFLPIFLFCFQFQFHAFTLCYRKKKILKFTNIVILIIVVVE